MLKWFRLLSSWQQQTARVRITFIQLSVSMIYSHFGTVLNNKNIEEKRLGHRVVYQSEENICRPTIKFTWLQCICTGKKKPCSLHMYIRKVSRKYKCYYLSTLYFKWLVHFLCRFIFFYLCSFVRWRNETEPIWCTSIRINFGLNFTRHVNIASNIHIFSF